MTIIMLYSEADRLYCINPFSVYLYMYSCLEQQVRTYYKTLRQYNNYNPSNCMKVNLETSRPVDCLEASLL